MFQIQDISAVATVFRPSWLTLLAVLFTFTTTASSSEPRVVCYYTNWSVYRPGTARFNPQNINPYLCTHLIYAFGGFTKENALKPFDKYQDIEKGGYAKFTGLKTYNKNLKTLLAIGGWNEGSTRFSPMVAARDRRKEFVRNAIKFLRQNRFDGLDLDWEYPAFRDGGKAKDRENYAKLVKELREEFERESEKTGKPRLLLTMAVPAGIEYIKKGFDVPTLNQYLDWMNLLTYDYHSAFEPAVNHHAPLYPLEEPNEYSVDTELNIDYTIKFYLESGADRDKLVLGIPTYGRSFTLVNAEATEVGAPAEAPGDQGEATREKGYLAYYEICEAQKPKEKKPKPASSDEDDSDSEEEEDDEPWTVVSPNPRAMGPYAYKGNQWVGYDDADIVQRKAEYVADHGLGGIMFWSIDNDDFRGNCHGKPYPLIEAAKEAYINKLGATNNAIVADAPKPISSNRRRNRPKTSTTARPTTAKVQSNKKKSSLSSTTPSWSIITPEPPTTPDPGADFKCTDEGFFPHPRDCKKYFWCLDSGPSNLGIVAHQFTCPSGLFFNKLADSCDFARNVICKKPSATTKAPTTLPPKTTTTTTQKPIKLSTKNSLLFRTTSTSTTTQEPEIDLEEEYEDEEEGAADIDSEDPKVIKELIDLIRKVGGVEQLEKQLHLSEGSNNNEGSTTIAAPINKKLYQKVLERTRGTNKFSGNSISGDNSAQNSRRGPQNAGLDSVSDADQKYVRKDRPQYTTINRNRPSTSSTTEEPYEEIEDESPEEPPQTLSRAISLENRNTIFSTSKPLQYVNIRRARPGQDADDEASRNALFERVEPYTTVDAPVSLSSARRENIPEYVTIKRQRPSTEQPTTIVSQYSEEDVDDGSIQIEEQELPSITPQYTSIVRNHPSTQAPEDNPSSPESATFLAVQISSLANEPSSEETHVESEAPEPEVETSSTTSTTTTTTTTTTTLPTTTKRTIPRRRGTTTTTTSSPTTASPPTTTQVSTRNISFKRRRPVFKTNEIVPDSEDSRKIRSTTPNSREVDGVLRVEEKVVQKNRFKPRIQKQDEDSVPAAATPVSRGQFRPRLSRDEVVSLTPIDDNKPPKFVPKQSFTNNRERRFRGKVTAIESIADSDTSAATVEAKRQNVLPRGRSRFVVSSAVGAVQERNKNAESEKDTTRRFNRFTPRPFTKAESPSPSTESVLIDNYEDDFISLAPARLPFQSISSTLQPFNQARKLPYPLTKQITAQAALPADNYADIEDRNDDDITISETAIPENREKLIDEPVSDTPRKRIIIKKQRPTTQGDLEQITPEPSVPENVDNKRKFKIIRRRPASSTTSEPAVIQETSSSAPQKIRKIIRKKIISNEPEPEIIAKSINSLKAQTEPTFNYGEKTNPTVVSSVRPSLEAITESSILINNNEEESPKINNENLPEESTKTNVEITETTTEIKPDIEIKPEIETKSETETNLEMETKPEIVLQNEEDIDFSEKEEPVLQADITSEKPSSTQGDILSTRARPKVPYKLPKRLFTSTTESIPSSSARTYSRKYNVGVYTSSPSLDRGEVKPSTRRTLFASKQFGKRPFSTARTTTKIEDEYEYSDEQEDKEEENQYVILPPNQLFTRKPNRPIVEHESEEIENSEENLEDLKSSRRPFKPVAVNSNTFRTSTSTTEIPKVNRTALFNRFASARQGNETRKRVQNIPVGYNSLSENDSKPTDNIATETDKGLDIPEFDYVTEDDYLSATETTVVTDPDSTATIDFTTSTEEMELDDSTNEYLESTADTTAYPYTFDDFFTTVEDNKDTTRSFIPSAYFTTQEPTTTMTTTTTTTTAAPVAPVVRTQFNKLYSVSRVVEVSSKLDKHKINRKNESRLVEAGKLMVEKKPTVDKIGEVSRYSLIKIVEDEIPIYLTKLGHVYPVENPPDNIIRIDEARNARALMNFVEGPRENLVASESINEAYRHLNKEGAQSKGSTKDQILHLPGDDFLTYVNDDKTTEKLNTLPSYEPDPSDWQFVPAAYEKEVKQNKPAKKFDVITPRNIVTSPSTLALEGLFKTELPVGIKQYINSDKPYIVYSATMNDDKEKSQISKSTNGKVIKSFEKGENSFANMFFESDSTTESQTYVTETAVYMKTDKKLEDITQPTTTDMYTIPTTTETIPDDTTTIKISPIIAKRGKFAFPRRIVKPSNTTRSTPAPKTTRTPKKLNSTVTNIKKPNFNKTFTNTTSKTRFTGRKQNVPVEIKSRKTITKSTPRSFTTEQPKTTTEKKVVIKQRPSFRPAFIPRKSTTAKSDS